MYGNHVQNAQKQLITHEDCTKQISQHQSSEMVLCVVEDIACRQDDAHEVQDGNEYEELAVCVEPEVEQNPTADLWLLWLVLGRLLDCGFECRRICWLLSR